MSEENVNEILVDKQVPSVNDNVISNQAQTELNKDVVQETDEEKNWKAFREARKREREAREEAEKRAAEKEKELAALKAAMEAAFKNQAPNENAYNSYYASEEEDSIEKKIEAVLIAREEKLQREREEREKREYPKKLLKDLPDFQNVCSQENLDYIDYHFPEISRPLQRLEEGYDKWHDIYHAVKKLVPNSHNSQKDAKKIEQNTLKPQSPSGRIINTDMSPPNSYKDLEERRRANWERMQRTLKGIG